MPSRTLWGAGLFTFACVAAQSSGQIAHATETTESAVVESRVRDSEARAGSWNLSREDWTRYEELMRGRRGVWTPDGDPLLVLGAHARTEAERRRYAEAFVLAEYQRVEGELAFERAVQAAWVRLFPGQLRVTEPKAARSAAERYAVVVDRHCLGCVDAVRSYVKGTVPVDLYVRGAGDDEDLRAWAAAQGIQVADVLGGRVTLNHGDAGIPGAAPAVWELRFGRWSAVQ